jgi:hypothetical protein
MHIQRIALFLFIAFWLTGCTLVINTCTENNPDYSMVTGTRFAIQGDTLVIGTGQAYITIFERKNGAWEYQTHISRSAIELYDDHRIFSSLTINGNIIAAGAPADRWKNTGRVRILQKKPPEIGDT